MGSFSLELLVDVLEFIRLRSTEKRNTFSFEENPFSFSYSRMLIQEISLDRKWKELHQYVDHHQ